MGGAWLASVDSPTLSEGIMKYFLSVLIPFGFVHPKPQGFDFTNNCRGGAICNTDIDIQKTVQIFRGGTMFGSTGGRGGCGEFGQGGGAPSGGAGGGRITIPARPSTPTTRSVPRCRTAVRDATTCVPGETDRGA